MTIIKCTVFFYLLFCFLHDSPSIAKVKIFTFAYNQPDFIELQQKLFQKFLKDDYEFVVFDDSQDSNTTDEISSVCRKHAINHIKVPQDVHDRPYLQRITNPWRFSDYNAPSVRNCNVVQYALDILGFDHDDILVLLESDVFLIKEFSFIEYMQDCDISGYNRSIEYNDNRKKLDFLWIGLIYLNMATLPHKHALNVNCGIISNIPIDSGGYLHYYLKNNTQINSKLFTKIRIENFICKNCENTKSYRCKHNAKELRKNGFDNSTIHFIQEVPIDWGSGVAMPNGTTSGLVRRNIEFLHNNNFVHFYGGSGYANQSPNHDSVQFYNDKTQAFLNYIYILLASNC